MFTSPQSQQNDEMEEGRPEKNKDEENPIISEFQRKMTELNISFLNSVQNAISENPACSLLPLIKDYLHYHRALLDKTNKTDGSSPPKTFESLGEFFQGLEIIIGTENDGAAGCGEPGPSQKRKIDNAAENDDAKMSSATESSSEPSVKKFAASPNSNPFANVEFCQSDAGDQNTVQIVHEADALFSTRCRVFDVLKERCSKLRGVGMLYLKKTEENRYQVLVRADNSQGKVILNIPLQKSLPMVMKGQDAIATVDITPIEDGTKASPIIIKMATWADADKLFEKLKELQQS